MSNRRRAQPQPQKPGILAGAVRARRSLDFLEQVGADDLVNLQVFITAHIAMIRGATFVDAVVDAAAEHGMVPPAAGADPVAWLDQQTAQLMRTVVLFVNARGALGHGHND